MAHHHSPGEHVTVEATKQPVGIWSGEHQTWWRANRCGYTRDHEAIGLYTMQEAIDATHHCGPEKQIVICDLPEIDDDPKRTATYMRNLASRAAHLWLNWNPGDNDPVGCPPDVADAITAWAETLVRANRKLEVEREKEEV